MAKLNTNLAPNLSATQPLIGIKTASTSMYILIPILRSIAVLLKVTAIWGSAVAITVASKFSIKKVTATSKAISKLRCCMGVAIID